MEATLNNTISTADAWRTAINLTLSDIRKFLSLIATIGKAFGAIVYLTVAMGLLFNESETLTYNAIGAVMFAILYLIIKKK